MQSFRFFGIKVVFYEENKYDFLQSSEKTRTFFAFLIFKFFFSNYFSALLCTILVH